MRVTEVTIRLVPPDNRPGKLLAYAAVVLDGCLAVKDLKVIEGFDGAGPFVAMPGRRLSDRCPGCGGKNPLLAAYCGGCGQALRAGRAVTPCVACRGTGKTTAGACGGCRGTGTAKVKLYADVAHPVTAAFRGTLEGRVLDAYEAARRFPDVESYHWEEGTCLRLAPSPGEPALNGGA